MKKGWKVAGVFILIATVTGIIVCNCIINAQDETWSEVTDMKPLAGKWATLPANNFNYALSVSVTGEIYYWGYNIYYTDQVDAVAREKNISLDSAWNLFTVDAASPYYIMDSFDPSRGPTPWTGYNTYAVWQTLPPDTVDVQIYINDDKDQIKAVGMIDGDHKEIYLGPRGY